MNFRTSKATGALAALLLAAGCATTPAPVPASTGPALWAVADADTTIYLFGTVHALPKDVPWMRGKIGPALAASDTLVTEIDLATADTAAMQAFVMKNALLGEQENLRDLLTQAQRARFEAGTAKLGMPVGAFDRFEPWYAALMFALVPLAKAGVVGENGVEQALVAQAGAPRERAALETMDYQLSLFDSLPREAQIDYLMKAVDGSDDIRAMLDAMVAEWLEGDADALARLMNEDMAGDTALMERLLWQRNRAWADWVAKRLDTPGTVFVAVGAGHLAGPRSVQADLAAKGLRVRRVQ
ncbi:TraB/GumN family protein [Parafrankia sp. BMG5.11]|nr:TraB/GumN family protein [Parafrankia sp. BMG5.11]